MRKKRLAHKEAVRLAAAYAKHMLVESPSPRPSHEYRREILLGQALYATKGETPLFAPKGYPPADYDDEKGKLLVDRRLVVTKTPTSHYANSPIGTFCEKD